MHSVVPTKGVKFKYVIGEKVLCYEPDPAKAKVLYESKVLDLVAGQENGRKRPEYLVHFFGWKNSWDRCVREDWVLPMTKENQELQRRLAEEAAIYLKGQSRIPPLFKETLAKNNNNKPNEKPENVSEPDSSDSSEEETEKEVTINIPEVLKLQLEKDWRCITKENKLVAIPCYPNVVSILEGFVEHSEMILIPKMFSESSTRREKQFIPEDIQDKLGLYKETVDGLRVYFDFTLPHLLLYGQEKKQHYSHCSTARPHRDHHEIAPTSLKVEPPSSDPEYTPEWEPSIVIKQEPASPVSVVPKRGRPRLRRNMPKPNANPVVETTTTTTNRKANHPLVVKGMTSRNSKSIAMKNLTLNARANLKEKIIQKRKKGRPKSLPTRILRSSNSPIKNSRLPVKKKSTPNKKMPVKKKLSKTPPCALPITIKTEPSTCEDRITRRGSVQARIARENHPAVKNKFCTPEHFSNQLTNKPEPSSFKEMRQRSVHSRLSLEHLFVASPFHLPIESPLSSPCSLVNSCSAVKVVSTGSSNGIQGVHSLNGRPKDALRWKMLPERVWEIVPAEPSLIYGAQHLLRLFVKLPDLISKMRIPNRNLEPLLDILNQFLAYMLEQKDRLFPPSAYVDCDQ